MGPHTLTLFVSLLATAVVVVVGTPVAWMLGRGPQTWRKRLVEMLILLPVVLPPTVVGYGLLLILGRGTTFGQWLNDSVGIQLLFTWQGAVIASAVMAFPLHVRTMIVAFSDIDASMIEQGKAFGASDWQIFKRIGLPIASRGLGAGTALAFARAAGEFGATLMVSGAIPGKTQTMPIALYESVMAGKDSEAMLTALGLLSITLVVVGFATILSLRRRPWEF
ncbi:MAG TPA: molybdate ABC transporter permease subunit [Fimbriimonadaceae bacterium]|nr:molybdate ABC transporter permease subunit [Fimbriimonadaceae bacterium]